MHMPIWGMIYEALPGRGPPPKAWQMSSRNSLYHTHTMRASEECFARTNMVGVSACSTTSCCHPIGALIQKHNRQQYSRFAVLCQRAHGG